MSSARGGKAAGAKSFPSVVAGGVLACLCLANAQSNAPGIADLPVARLETEVPRLMREADIPGMSITLIRGGKIAWHGNFGVKNAKSAQPIDDDTVFEAASLSKPVFAYAVLKLVEQGKLGLDLPLTTYLPKPYIENDPRVGKITARFVLSHRTGFPNWRGSGNLTIHFTPGERFSYSGEGFVYLQRVVEQIEGKPLNDVMNALVFSPLGMTGSSYVRRPDFDERTATGHDSDGAPEDLWKPKEAGAASSLNTTVRDYALFVTAVLNGKGLKPSTFREMETAQIAVNPECTNCTEKTPKELSQTVFWGLGWGLQKNGTDLSLWHWGDNGSFKCFVVADPSRKSGVILFINSENGLAIAPAVVRDATGAESPAFGWIKYDAYDSPAMKFRKAIREQGVEAALGHFAAQLRDGTIPEGAVNSVAYHLLWRAHQADAIRVFRLNTELHPQSANAFDSLGEGYMQSGEKALAILNYEKSLALDPKNSNAVEQLKKLRASSD